MPIKSIDLIDYDSNRHTVNIDMMNVKELDIELHSGDEILKIINMDGTEEYIDPMKDSRVDDFFQGCYSIYDINEHDDNGEIYDATKYPYWANRHYPEDPLIDIYKDRLEEMQRNESKSTN